LNPTSEPLEMLKSRMESVTVPPVISYSETNKRIEELTGYLPNKLLIKLRRSSYCKNLKTIIHHLILMIVCHTPSQLMIRSRKTLKAVTSKITRMILSSNTQLSMNKCLQWVGWQNPQAKMGNPVTMIWSLNSTLQLLTVIDPSPKKLNF